MGESKLHQNPKEYYEGEEAAQRFDKVVQDALHVTPAELKRRHEAWERARKANRKKT